MKKPNYQKFNKWLRIKDAVEQEFYQMLSYRRIFEQYKTIVDSNPNVGKEGAIFHNWVTNNYVTHVAMAIRRQTDVDPDVRSLAKLIIEIKENPTDLTRAHFISLWNTDNQMFAGVANAQFTEYAGEGEFFDPNIAAEDLKTLEDISKNVTALADRTIAHNSKQPVPKVSFSDANRCLDIFSELLRKYIVLLTAGDNLLEPVMPYDWQAIFTTPWIKSKQ